MYHHNKMGSKQIILKVIDSKINFINKLYVLYCGHLYLMLRHPILDSLATNSR